MKEGNQTPQRQTQVAEQSDRLNRNMVTLHDRIEQLVDRLSSVLKLAEPPLSGEGRDSEELVVLAATIKTFADSVRSAKYKIESILERIEL